MKARTAYGLAAAACLGAGCGFLVGIDDHHLSVDDDGGADGNDSATDEGGNDAGATDATTAADATDAADATTAADVTDAADAADAAPVVLARGQQYPNAVAVDSTSVYWLNETSGGQPGAIMKMDKDGGTPQVLVTGLTRPTDLAIDAQYVYFTNDVVLDAAIGGGLFRVDKNGGNAIAIDTNATLDGYGSLALDDTYAYTEGTRVDASTRVRKSRKDGVAPSVECFVYTGTQPTHFGPIAADVDGVFFGSLSYGKVLRGGPDCTTATHVFADTSNPVLGIASDDASVFWTEGAELIRLDKEKVASASVTLRLFGNSAAVAGDIALHGSFVYVVGTPGSSFLHLWKVDKAGDATLAKSFRIGSGAGSVAVDDDGYAYVSMYGLGQIVKIDAR